VNNVGRAITRPVSELTDEDIDQMMAVNVKTALYGMQAAVAQFRRQGHGHLINISTMLGRVPIVPVRSAYSASKHFLNSLTANLRMELASTPIRVSLVSPGVVATDFGLNALHGGVDSRALPFAQSAEKVAELVLDVIDNPRADTYTQPDARKQVAAYYGAEDLAAYEAQMMQRR
jgi:short-subunit dehydrogenase